MKIHTAAIVFVIALLAGWTLASKWHKRGTPAASPPAHIVPVYPATSVFDQALNANTALRVTDNRSVIGAVVNHHLLAADFIVDTLNQAVGQNIDRIVILSPNHFFAGHGFFISTHHAFATPYGDTDTDQTLVRHLTNSGAVLENSEAFLQEHGVYNLLPFIRSKFPGIPIVPIIVRDGVTNESIDQLRMVLGQQVTTKTLIVASLDFAHHQTNDGAKKLDAQSMTWLRTVDPMAVRPNTGAIVAVDSPPTLKLFLALMRDRGATDFTLSHHSNAAVESGHLEATDVTSYITGLFRIPPVEQ